MFTKMEKRQNTNIKNMKTRKVLKGVFRDKEINNGRVK